MNSHVEAIRSFAEEHGVTMDDHDINVFLFARKLLRDPSQSAYFPVCKKIVDMYTTWFSRGGPKPSSFAELMLPFDLNDDHIEG